VEHVALAKKADVFLVAPATANVIAKMAAGIADDMLTTTFLAASCPKIIAPP
jgi:phosphopantothenoylcysteine decarboxylase/phosphopantothenate--cysteine ligase